MSIDKISPVSVIIPIFNEEKYVPGLLESLRNQDYDKTYMEYIFVDGGSTDKTIELIESAIKEKSVSAVILRNEKRTAPSAMNLGIRKSRGEIIVRMDAHSRYPESYISKCVYYLKNSDADNVGCPWRVIGEGRIGVCISKVVTSIFGVGSSGYRIENEAYNNRNVEYTDTVPYGTFYRSLFERIGFFNENYPRAEDNDFNYRIRKNGGKILLIKDIQIDYFCRDSLSALIKMGFGNGYSIGLLFRRDREQIKLKYLIPLLFLLSVIAGILILTLTDLYLLKFGFAAEMIIYFACALFFAAKAGAGFFNTFIIAPFFFFFHVSYGAGVLLGILKIREK